MDFIDSPEECLLRISSTWLSFSFEAPFVSPVAGLCPRDL